MLRLIDVCKSYKIGKNKVVILDKINLDFKKSELVFILGKSGSGKSTLLNIIGGLLDVDSGNVLLDDLDITKFNNSMLCNYRNNMIGFVFQDYHLIEYMSVLDNIKLGMTICNNDTNDRIEDILRKLEIYSKRKIKVNKLSGGEKQRVAIARAIINNPDIILCDEPTGALDSVNGIKIMNILKELSKEKLVIVVSHDNAFANKYADRVINIVDGKIDYYPQMDIGKFDKIEKKNIKIFNLIKLALNNLGLKKVRTLFTSLAISIGFICMLMVLCLSKSFNDEINELKRNIVSVFPISVYNGDFEINDSKIVKANNNKIIKKNKKGYIYTNKINSNYLDYVNNIDEIKYVSYEYNISMPIISDKYNNLDNRYMKMLPSNNYIYNNYDILYGRIPESIYEIVLKVDSNNSVDEELLDVFNIDDDIEYSEIMDRKLKIILNDIYYVKNGDYYFINNDDKYIYDQSDLELKIVGIIREKEVVDNNSYFYYSNDLINYIIDINSDSRIVNEQINKDYNILGMDIEKDDLLSYLGYNALPSGISIYVSDLDKKEIVLEKLDKYNNENEKLIYVDTMNDAVTILKNVVDIITVILVIFSMISILVSSLMIFILTNNRVMERIKEIGILRSLGARCKDITRLFNIENLIIGIISSIIGIMFVMSIKNPINVLLQTLLEERDVFKIHVDLMVACLVFNIFVVFLSGYIPSLIAGKKNIIECIKNK